MSTPKWTDLITSSLARSEHANTEFYLALRVLAEAAEGIRKGIGAQIGQDLKAAGYNQDLLAVAARGVQHNVRWVITDPLEDASVLATLHITSASAAFEHRGLMAVAIPVQGWPVTLETVDNRRRVCANADELRETLTRLFRDPIIQTHVLGAGRL